jgi:hypothetical protein
VTTEVCRRWRELFGAYLLGHLSPEERVGLEAHLDGCAECRAELEELRPVAGALAAADPAHLGSPPAPPPELADRVFAHVRDARRLERRRRLAVRLGAGIAAAVIALVVVVATRPGPAPPRAEKEDFAFSALPAGVEAVATLYTYKKVPGVEVWIEYEGLTPGVTYAVWVERASGERVRCGTFDAIGGRRHTVLASKVSRADAAAVGMSSTDGRVVMRAPVSPPS